MANFPDSIYSPAAKASGQTITAAFFNDPDGEITAIEQGYRNGTAPLNSSGSTVATLSVTGASTFGTRPVEPPPDAALVFLGSTVTLGSSAQSTLTWTQQAYAVNSSLHSTTTNPARLTPQSTGIYQFQAQVVFSENSTGHRMVLLRDSSGSVFAGQAVSAFAGNAHYVNVSGLKRFDAVGGYGVVTLTLSGNSTLSLSSGVDGTWFAIHKL